VAGHRVLSPGFYKLNSRIAPSRNRRCPTAPMITRVHLKILWTHPVDRDFGLRLLALSRDFCVGDSVIDATLEKIADGCRARRRRRP